VTHASEPSGHIRKGLRRPGRRLLFAIGLLLLAAPSLEVRSAPATPEEILATARAEIAGGDLAGARRRLEAARRTHGDSAAIARRLAEVRFALRDLDGALEAADAAVELEPESKEALLLAARVRVELGDVAGARGRYAKILRLGPAPGRLADWRLARKMLRDRVLVRGPSWPRREERRIEGFVIRTDAGPAAADGLSVHLERAEERFGAVLPPRRRSAASPALVLGFSDRTEYVRFLSALVGDGAFVPSTAGLYIPEARCLAILVRRPLERSLPTVFHEAFHLAAHRSIGTLPRWLDEGLADTLSAGLAAESYPRFAVPTERLTALRARVGRKGIPDVRTVIELPDAAFSDPARAAEAYALAWALVDFLVRRDTADGTNRVRGILDRLREGVPAPHAVREGLGRAEGLDAPFAEHVRRRTGEGGR
jgi:tetratricopeptide (TPR) repeat protein